MGGEGGTVGGNVIALVGEGAPGGAGVKGEAVSAVVVRRAAARNGNARASGSAPSEARVANALAGLAVVSDRTNRRNIVAPVSRGAPAGSRQESEALAASVVGVAAGGDRNACLLGGAPTLALRADALPGKAVVGGKGGTVGGNIVALVGDGAPGGAGAESKAAAAVVICGAAGGNADASALGGTPAEPGVANACAGLTIMIVRALRGDVVALAGESAPGRSGVKARAISAPVGG